MNACDSGDEDIVQLLLEYSEDRNIDLNARDGYERTAFMIAYDSGGKGVVQLLLQYSNDDSRNIFAFEFSHLTNKF